MSATTTNTPASITAQIVTPFPAPQDAPQGTPQPSSVLDEFITEQTALADMAHDLRVHGLDALHDWELDEPASDFTIGLLENHG